MLSSSCDKNPSKIVVHSLIGKKGLPFYLTCLDSLQFFSSDPVKLYIHSDGSLEQEDKILIQEKLGQDIEWVGRKEADELVLEKLIPYKNCFKLRKNSIWGIELFDYHMIETSELSFWCDADVRFFRPYKGLFTIDAAENKCVFLRDTNWHAYTFHPKHLMGPKKLPVCSGINTGLNLLDKKFYDLEFIDWFLGQKDFFRIPEWVVPSCYAALGARCNSFFVEPQQILNLYPNAKIGAATFAGHFLSSYRQERKAEFEFDWKKKHTLKAPIATKMEACKLLKASEYSINLIKRRIANRLDIYL
jgi:hypothetical protein